METVKEFILNHFDQTIRFNPKDEGTLIGLPEPYTVPSIEGMFQEMYYWDTYFTNVGLILCHKVDQAKHNIDNMLYLIDQYGYMPNGNRTFYLTRSQPPFLSLMIYDVYKVIKDKAWLKRCYYGLEKEYDFWQTHRKSENGLNYYDGIHYTKEDLKEMAVQMCQRFDMPFDESKIEDYGHCFFAFCESGWDCNSRFGYRAHLYNSIDQNALLYAFEMNMHYFANELNLENSWLEKATQRQSLMNQWMWNDEKGVYFDYDYQNHCQNNLISCASYYTMFTKVCHEDQAKQLVESLKVLNEPYGIACCQKTEDLYDLQWDHPHGWACLHYIAIAGLLNYGYEKEAKEIASKYLHVVERNFEKTHQLWEKYNVVTGEVSTTKEYESPTMLGWSAGVYLYCLDLLTEK